MIKCKSKRRWPCTRQGSQFPRLDSKVRVQVDAWPLLKQLRQLAPHQLPRYPKRTRAAKRRMYELQPMTASQREYQQVPKYRQLITIAEETLKNARDAVNVMVQVQSSWFPL